MPRVPSVPLWIPLLVTAAALAFGALTAAVVSTNGAAADAKEAAFGACKQIEELRHDLKPSAFRNSVQTGLDCEAKYRP